MNILDDESLDFDEEFGTIRIGEIFKTKDGNRYLKINPAGDKPNAFDIDLDLTTTLLYDESVKVLNYILKIKKG